MAGPRPVPSRPASPPRVPPSRATTTTSYRLARPRALQTRPAPSEGRVAEEAGGAPAPVHPAPRDPSPPRPGPVRPDVGLPGLASSTGGRARASPAPTSRPARALLDDSSQQPPTSSAGSTPATSSAGGGSSKGRGRGVGRGTGEGWRPALPPRSAYVVVSLHGQGRGVASPLGGAPV